MHWTGWICVGLAVVLGGWLAFDGARALVIGDYVTPSSGRFAGQLGPWSKLVTAVGLAPRSTAVKLLHVVVGIAWLAAIACFVMQVPGARWAMLACAVASLWYLPFGTLIAVVEIALLLWSPLRG